MRFKAGVIQVLLLLLALSVIAASSVAIMAQQKVVERKLSLARAIPNPSPIISPQGPCYPFGDVNNDGLVSAVDAQLILQYVARLYVIPNQFRIRADVNKDGLINAVDSQIILRYVAGSAVPFPACIR